MYHIRKANLEDLPVLLELEQGLIAVERPMDPTIKEGDISYYDLEGFVSANDTAVLVAEHDGKIVASGYARIKGDRHYLKHKNQAYLGFMFVVEEHRGKALNKLIIDKLLSWCKTKGVYEIRLDVYEDNVPAIRAYQKVGFKKHMINMRMNIEDLDV